MTGPNQSGQAPPSAGRMRLFDVPFGPALFGARAYSMWTRFAAMTRIIILVIVAWAAFGFSDTPRMGGEFLAFYFTFGFITSSAYYWLLLSEKPVPHLLTWGQVLVDLSVVAATVMFTGGPTSGWTFLFVIVVLEATLLMRITDGFIYATLATGFLLMAAWTTNSNGEGSRAYDEWFGLIAPTMAFYLTVTISGFWNLRLRRLQQFQQEVLDHLNNGFLIADPEGRVRALNKAGEYILGLTPGSWEALPVQQILRVQSGAESPVLTALRSDQDFTSYEFQASIGDHDSKLLGLTTSRIRDERGKLSGVIASFSDLTEMDMMRRDLRRQDRLAVVGELAAGLAHEIRNPLTAIRGAVEELGRSMETPQVADRLASIAIREADQLNQIVQGFLDFARNPEVHRESFDIRTLVQEVAELIRLKYESSENLNVHLDSPNSAVLTSADRSQLKQVLINIARNGVEAMERTGTLAIRVEPLDKTVEITIADEGPGIGPDEVARIFEPFYTTKDAGVGMGLAVCQRIVTAHDGTIQVTQRESGGTAMTVRLPMGVEEE